MRQVDERRVSQVPTDSATIAQKRKKKKKRNFAKVRVSDPNQC